MTIIYLSYLFDDIAFRKIILPIVPKSETGDHGPLHDLSKRIMDDDPQLWRLLEDWFLGQPFAEVGETATPRRLLMMILAKFLQPMPKFDSGDRWLLLETVLPHCGWQDDDVNLLIHGKSLCQLVLSTDNVASNVPVDLRQDLPWCTGFAGWLDLETIERLHSQLNLSQEMYFSLADQSGQDQSSELGQQISEKIGLPNHSPQAYSNKLKRAYSEANQILAKAQEVEKSLVTLISG